MVLLSGNKTVKIFNCIEILVEIFPLSICIEKLLLVVTFCPFSDERNAINSLLSILGDRNSIVRMKFSLFSPQKISSWWGPAASSKASFISSNPYSSLIFSRTASSCCFLFTYYSSTISSASDPNKPARAPPSWSFRRSLGNS